MLHKRSYILYVFLIALAFFTLNFISCVTTGNSVNLMNLYNAGNYEKVITTSKKMALKNPNNSINWYWTALSYYSLGMKDPAYEAFQKVVNLSSGVQAFDSYKYLVMLDYANSKPEQVISNGKAAMSLFYTNQFKDPENTIATIYYYLGSVYYNAGNYEELEKICNEIIIWDVGYTYTFPSWASEYSYHRRGWCHIQSKHYQSALYDFENALSVKSISYFTEDMTGCGYANLYLGNYTTAIKNFNQVIEKTEASAQSGLSRVYKGKAFAYLGLGDKETAISMLQKAKEVDKNFAADDYLALVYYASGDKETAYKYRGGSGFIGISVKVYTSGSISGLKVTNISEGSPARKSGFLTDDIILKADDELMTTTSAFIKKCRALTPGSSLSLTFLREGYQKNITLIADSANAYLEENALISNYLKSKK